MIFPEPVFICDGCGVDSLTHRESLTDNPGNKFVMVRVTNTSSLDKLFDDGHLCPECWCKLQDILVTWRYREAEK